MFHLTKIKIAGAIAAGAVALGAAGAYAANNGTILLSTQPKPAEFGAKGPSGIVTLNGTTPSLESFKNVGDCVSFFASNRDLALATSISGNKLAKNFHGKLVSATTAWCRDHVTKSDNDSASTDSEPADSDGSASGGSSHHPRR